MNVKFVIRGLILALPVAVLIAAIWIWLQTPFGRPPDPTPPPPTILAPRGEMPAGPLGLQEWAQYRGEAYRPVGCGFLLSTPGGQVVGVTTAHSVSLGDPDRPLERIALGVPGRENYAVESDTLRGAPGRSRTGQDMTVDYVLLQPDVDPDPDLVFTPDPRGAPQPGERVWLYSGRDNDGHKPFIPEGTVQSAGDTAIWVLMDDWFEPQGMSGSPLVSQHTGHVVGMVVAVSPRRGRLLLGAHPVGSIVRLTESASEFPTLAELSESQGRGPD